MINVQQALVNIENDHRAARTNLSLNYGNLSGIENSPTATWNGTLTGTRHDYLFNYENRTEYIFAPSSWDVTFTRLDGRNIAPICELGFEHNIPGGFYNAYFDEGIWDMYLLEIGNNYIKFRLKLKEFSDNKESINMSIVVQAISPINGSLSIVRI